MLNFSQRAIVWKVSSGCPKKVPLYMSYKKTYMRLSDLHNTGYLMDKVRTFISIYKANGISI
jgi:hypothetical protein